MTLKHIVAFSATALALTVAGTALAAEPAASLVSGDQPMNVGNSAQIKAPDPSAAGQAKTEAMLKKEAPLVSGDQPMNVGNSAQIKAPDPSAAGQKKTEAMLKKEAPLVSGDQPMNPREFRPVEGREEVSRARSRPESRRLGGPSLRTEAKWQPGD